MRYQTLFSVSGFFAGDLPSGGLLIECQSCFMTVESEEDFGEPLFCSGCGKEIHYPDGVEW